MTTTPANTTPDSTTDKDRVGKGHLVAQVAERTGLHPRDAKRAVEAVFETIKEELAAGRRLTVQDFGAFHTRIRKATTRRNPHTGESYAAPESLAIKLTPATSLKNRLNGK